MTHRSDHNEAPSCRTALFPGSFNPFTKGHESLARRSLALCDRLVIAIGVNPAKNCDDARDRAEEIKHIFADEPRIVTAVYNKLTGEFARDIKADFMIRGVRGVADFDFEQRLAETNLRLFGIETILLPALPELAWISSSTVRELRSFGYDTSELLPENMKNK